jgi:hypothetical protein
MSTVRTGFQVGGAVQADALYVERKGDRELLEALRHGEFCYILAPRQIGKSSLRIRVARALAAQGVRCVSIDFSGIGSTSVTIDEWYYSIADDIAQALGLPNLDLFWTTHQHLTPVHRWYRFIRNELLDRVAGPIVVFIDEVDSVLALSFVTDDFFASIRSAYNLRADDPEYGRLTFCLLGVAAPADLIQNSVRTPFNIGREIRLDDFSRAELGALLPGLDGLGCDPVVLLDAVYAWTSGHPYMTQRLCDDLTRHGPIEPGQESARVDDAAYNLFVRSGRGGDANLAYAEKRLDANQSRMRVRQILHLYRRLLDGERVPAEPNSQNQTELRLTGLAAEHLGAGGEIHLRTRNLIFAEVYDHKWLKTKEKEQRLAELVDRWVSQQARRLPAPRRRPRGRPVVVGRPRRPHRRRPRVPARRRQLRPPRGRGPPPRRGGRPQGRGHAAQGARGAAQGRPRALPGRHRARAARASRRGGPVPAPHDQHPHRHRRDPRHPARPVRVAVHRRREQQDPARRAQRPRPRGRRPQAEGRRGVTAGPAGRQGARGPARGDPRRRQQPPERPPRALARDAGPRRRRRDPRAAPGRAPPQRADHRRRILARQHRRADRQPRPLRPPVGRRVRPDDPQPRRGRPVQSASFSLDNTRIFTVSADRVARLWNASSGDLLESYKGLVAAQPPRFVAVADPFGTRALLAYADRTLRLTDLRSPRVIETLRGHTGLVTAAAFSSDGLALLTACSDGSARLWSAEDGKLRATLRRHTGALRSVAFSPSGTRIITIGEDDTPRLWNEVGACTSPR